MKLCPFKQGIIRECDYQGCMAWKNDLMVYNTTDPLSPPDVLEGYCKLIERRG